MNAKRSDEMGIKLSLWTCENEPVSQSVIRGFHSGEVEIVVFFRVEVLDYGDVSPAFLPKQKGYSPEDEGSTASETLVSNHQTTRHNNLGQPSLNSWITYLFT
jgi:hypothetical protein